MNKHNSIIITEDELKELMIERYNINKQMDDINITYHNGSKIEYPCFTKIEFFWKDKV